MRELDVRPNRGLVPAGGPPDGPDPLGEEEMTVPLQLGAVLIALLAILFIIVNAAFLQSAPHPAPMFQTRVEAPAQSDAASTKSSERVLPRPTPSDEQRRIMGIQVLLHKKGYDVGEIDGVFGTRTKNAILAFERDRGYPETGSMTPLLLKRLKRALPRPAPSTAPPAPKAAPSDSSDAGAANPASDKEDVLLVQRALSDLGYGPLDIDGLLGAQTAQAIQRFELDRGLPITGKIGDRIVAELVLIGGVKPVATR
ncbi:MAG: peptidoglycan-binding domain-containing protein [Pseudomonadota bacterium]